MVLSQLRSKFSVRDIFISGKYLMARKERENGSSVNARTIPLTVEHTTRNNDSVNAAFCNYLETRNGEVCESKEGNIKRSQIISKLQGILEGWVCDIAVKKTTTIGSARLRVFGSQRLGCHNASADIDCLCLAPNLCTKTWYQEQIWC